MTVAPRQSRRFDASSPVTRYWLANCVGFAVGGAASGVVEAVRADDGTYEAEELVVRCRRRTRILPASAVVAVVPAERRLVVAHAPRPTHVRTRRTAGAVRRGTWSGSRLLARALARLCVLGWRLACRGWAAGAPLALEYGRRGRDETARLIASVPWHRFGPSARSATTRAWLELSTRSSRLRTTSSRTRNARDSAPETNTTSST